MSLWSKLFGNKETKPAPPPQSKPVQAPTADSHWENAIAAADAGEDAAALASFQRAIEMNPDYYVSVIQPASARANGCWKRAVDQYVNRKDAETKAIQAKPSQAAENHCACCGKDLGTRWHYDFESIVLATTIGTQCPDCGRTVCNDDLKFGQDGNYPPCPNCGAKIQVMAEGPAYSSMVEQARRERRYRGAIHEPSTLGRMVVDESALQRDAKPFQEDLLVAVRNGDVEKARAILDDRRFAPTKPENRPLHTGITPLGLAVSGRKEAMVKFLLGRGAQANLTDTERIPPILNARRDC